MSLRYLSPFWQWNYRKFYRRHRKSTYLRNWFEHEEEFILTSLQRLPRKSISLHFNHRQKWRRVSERDGWHLLVNGAWNAQKTDKIWFKLKVTIDALGFLNGVVKVTFGSFWMCIHDNLAHHSTVCNKSCSTVLSFVAFRLKRQQRESTCSRQNYCTQEKLSEGVGRLHNWYFVNHERRVSSQSRYRLKNTWIDNVTR